MNFQSRINRAAIISWSIILSIVGLGYVVEVLKDMRTVTYLMTFLLMNLGLLTITFTYNKLTKGESELTKYFVIVGYFLFYTWNMLTTRTSITTFYILPIIILSLMYFDKRIIKWQGIVAILLNIAMVIKRICCGYTEPLQITDYEIQVIGMLVIILVVYRTSDFIKSSVDNNMLAIQERAEACEKASIRNQEIVDAVAEIVKSTKLKLNTVEDNTNCSVDALGQINNGILNISENIQNQTIATERIDNYIVELGQKASGNTTLAEKSYTATIKGSELMQNVTKNADSINIESAEMQTSIQELLEKMKEASELNSKMKDISNQTNLLSLNASIEAARAGDAGKGFGVVAVEIGVLAKKANQMTTEIETILANLNRKALEVGTTIDDVSNLNKLQSETVSEANLKFNEIKQSIEGLKTNTVETAEKLNKLVEDNKDIVSNIIELSALSQEITASTSETLSKSQENLDAVSVLSKNINELHSKVCNI